MMNKSIILNSINESKFENQIQMDNVQTESNDKPIEIDYESLFKQEPFKILKISFGSNEIWRFSCANHKLNLAVRGAISIHQELT